MTRVLIMIAAVGFVVAIACFTAAGLVGGFAWETAGPPWRSGPPWGPQWRHSWAHGWRQTAWVDGPTVTRDYPWTGADHLHVDASGGAQYTQGPTSKLTISGPQALLDHLVVQGGRIGFDGWNGGAPPLKIVLTAPNVSDFETSGSQTLSIANYKQDQLTIGVSGSGDIVAKGEAKRTTLRISGSGDADLGALAGDDVTVRISGSGGATIAPKASADVHISGSGHVTLLTHPADLNTDISGSGSVTQSASK